MSSDASDLLEPVRNIMARTFRVDPSRITAETGYGEITEWDSLGHLSLMMEIEAKYSVRFSTEQIGQPRTVEELCNLLNEVMQNG